MTSALQSSAVTKNAPRILIAVTGSLGDLNPMLAIGEQLLGLGAEVRIATLSSYQDACARRGLPFLPLGRTDDHVGRLRYTREMIEADSFERFVERMNFEDLELLYAQLLTAAGGADVLVAPAHVAPAHLVAEKLGIPYVACASCVIHIRPPAVTDSESEKRLAAAKVRWNAALRSLRQAQGLERRVLPLASFLSDAAKVLGILPSFLLSAAHLRTPNLEVVGYADLAPAPALLKDEELRAFCNEQTVAFSFGSFADACDPSYFFEESVAACRRLNLKCVYLSQHATPAMIAARAQDVLVRSNSTPGIVFPLAGMAVHHGATGTLMAACKHCKPMVIVPFVLDQPEHAERMQGLIGAPIVPAARYDRDSATDALLLAQERRQSMRAQLRELMNEYSDGAERAAHQILATLCA